MPFFMRPQVQHPFHTEDDLFNLLTALDPTSNPCAQKQRQHKKPEPTFTPRFDVLETPSTYELYGELAGLKQEDLSIEFEDVQTLIIKGKTTRQEPSVTSQKAKEVKPTPEAKQVTEKEHQPTVEDDYDVADTPLSTPSTTTTTPVNEKVEEKKEEQAPKPKYWISERRTGAFERTFSFSQRLDIDEVRAELKDGVLRVVVPKSQKSKKVAVSLQ